jgi:hypothetical protein
LETLVEVVPAGAAAAAMIFRSKKADAKDL